MLNVVEWTRHIVRISELEGGKGPYSELKSLLADEWERNPSMRMSFQGSVLFDGKFENMHQFIYGGWEHSFPFSSDINDLFSDDELKVM